MYTLWKMEYTDQNQNPPGKILVDSCAFHIIKSKYGNGLTISRNIFSGAGVAFKIYTLYYY